jgi:hypothetical protein
MKRERKKIDFHFHQNLLKERPPMNSRTLRALLLAALCTAIPAALPAQTYSIDWYTIDGGGGTSTGGVYSVSGTIGQPDAGGPMTGGNFTLSGGFWTLFAIQTPGAPVLRIFLTTTNTAVVAWPNPSTGFGLQQNLLLNTTNWVAVTNSEIVVGGEKRVTISPPAGNRYFRLFKP